MFLRSLGFLVVSALVVLAQNLELEEGWSLAGATEDISDMSAFEQTCVNTVWTYENGTWGKYSPDGTQGIQSIEEGQGFWIKTDTDCTIETMTVVKSSLERETDPNVTEENLDQLVSDNNDFAWELYHSLSADKDDGFFFSPFSISTALAMTYAGAKNDTKTQMQEALHFSLSDELFHPAFNSLDKELSSRTEDEENNIFLDIANALWGEIAYREKFQQDFLDTLALHYGAGMQLLDFINQPEESRETINSWVENQTHDKIVNLIPKGSINNATRLVLTNAIYFNAKWGNVFYEESTQKENFTQLDGSTTEVDMMHQTEDFVYYQGDHYQAIRLPYIGYMLEMLIIVPDSGNYDDVENTLDSQMLNTITNGWQLKTVHLGIPKFKFKSPSISLMPYLEQMGMIDAFTDDADFSGIHTDDTLRLQIADILHQAFISVTEEGTEAAAATAVIAVPTGSVSIEEPITLTIDRPFIYLIRDSTTNQILFMGRMLEPTFE